jgi:isoleucyl-tRNA synthetase
MVVTEEGKKMSKSLGNDVPPERVIKDSGAEILRLWVASVDYREEVRFGPEILARVVEAYRKLRNTLRILAANLADFNPATDMVPPQYMEEVDRYAMARYGVLAKSVVEGKGVCKCVELGGRRIIKKKIDLSAFYVDVSKDRTYTLAPASRERRSAQTAMFAIADGLARLIAPVLPVLAEEYWKHLPGDREPSVHLAEFPQRVHLFIDEPLMTRWGRLMKLRAAVNAELEKLRQAKTIGQSLEAVVRLQPEGALAGLIAQYRDTLAALCIVSQVDIVSGGATDGPGSVYAEADDSTIHISAAHADGTKCDRCWRWVPEVATSAGHEGVCPRCEQALTALGR